MIYGGVLRAARIGAAVGGLAMLSAAASASMIEAQFINNSPSRPVMLSIDGGLNYAEHGAGRLNWLRIGGDYGGVGASFTTFCAELAENVAPSHVYVFDVVAPAGIPNTIAGGMGGAKAALLAELYGRFYDSIDFGVTNNAAAYQIAVWEIIYDDGLSLAGDELRVQNNGHYFTIAQNWLNALDGTGSTMDLDGFTALGVQDQIVIPEPGSSLLLALGGLALAARRPAGRRA